jgi:hypothetical protein
MAAKAVAALALAGISAGGWRSARHLAKARGVCARRLKASSVWRRHQREINDAKRQLFQLSTKYAETAKIS